jgi:hypothetical protein
MKLVTWLAKDSETLFGSINPRTNTNTRTNVQITAIGQLDKDASQYVGLSNEATTPTVCTVITTVPADTFYNIYNPINGYFLTDTLVTSILKELRQVELDALTVTVGTAVYNADETSQGRMSRAYMVLGDSGTIPWKMADNTTVTVTGSELKQALGIAGAAQSALWAKFSL